MEYRKLSTGEELSIIGLGGPELRLNDGLGAEETIEYAYENGINIYDMPLGKFVTFKSYGNVLASVRDKIYYQIHFGATFPDEGDYARSLDPEQVKRSIDAELRVLKTDYIDFGFIHCIDDESEWIKIQENGLLDYMRDLKKAGVIKKMGMSIHTPELAQKMLDTGEFEHFMFSINPAYDYNYGNYDYARGEASERKKLYERCEKDGISISVMKPFAGGTLLNADASPFKKSLTIPQCIQYCLDMPAVKSVITGVHGKEHLKGVLEFFNATPEEKDYTIISTFTPEKVKGRCVYCNHCQPCPGKLDVGAINKYYDLAKSGDELAREHYGNLERKASDCIECGHCNQSCPFGVDQVARMKEIAEYFGK